MNACSHSLVVVILVNFHGEADTAECIQSLRSLSYENYKIIVVDNDAPSENKNLKGLSDFYIRSENNLGFSKANNLGLKYAEAIGAEYYLLLNNDTTVCPGILERFLNRYKNNPRLGILGCGIAYYDSPHTSWYNGARLNWWTGESTHLDIGHDVTKITYHSKIDYVTGCAMFFSKEVLRVTGGLPEQYFMYFEDVAYSLLAVSMGYHIDYIPEVLVYHKVGRSGGGGDVNPLRIYYGNKATRIFLNSEIYKTLKVKRLSAVLWFYIKQTIKMLKFLGQGKTILLGAVFRGTFR